MSLHTDGRDIVTEEVYMLASNLKTAISLAQSELSERGQEETIFAEGLRTIYKALLDGKTIKIKN